MPPPLSGPAASPGRTAAPSRNIGCVSLSVAGGLVQRELSKAAIDPSVDGSAALAGPAARSGRPSAGLSGFLGGRCRKRQLLNWA